MSAGRETETPRAGSGPDEADTGRKRLSPVVLGGIAVLVLGFAGAFGYVATKPARGSRGGGSESLTLPADWAAPTLPAPGSLVLAELGGGEATLRPLDMSSAHFDFGDDGFAERASWPGQGTGILGFLVPGETGAQRFQIVTGAGMANPLAGFDENVDGRIDRDDDFWFARIAVWNDVDADGFVGPREIRLLTSYFVEAIAFDPMLNGAIPPEGRSLGVIRFSDGSDTELREMRPRTAPAETIMLVPTSFQWDERVYLLPNLRERGLIPSTAFAMTVDPGLLETGTRLSDRLRAGELALFRAEFPAFVTTLAAPGRGVPRFDDPRLETIARAAGVTRNGFDELGAPTPSEDSVAASFNGLVNDLALEFCLQAVALHVPSAADRMYAAHPLAWLDRMRTPAGFEPDLRVIVERGADEIGRGAMTPDDLIALVEIIAPTPDPEALRALRDRRFRARIDTALGPGAREFHRRLEALVGDV